MIPRQRFINIMAMFRCSDLRWLLLPCLCWGFCFGSVQATEFTRYSHVPGQMVGRVETEHARMETVVMDTVRTAERFKRANTESENITAGERIKDDHVYYEAEYYSGDDAVEEWWVDLDSNATRHGSLSISARRAAVIPLRFDYGFYGHNLSSVVITTGGFLYVGPYLHPYLAETQYIAPLMANFDLSSDDLSQVKYNDDGNVFTAEWYGIQLRDAESGQEGRFTFQVSILNDSRIVFVYKEIPIPVEDIPTTAHPVKVGIADAYYYDIPLAPYKIRREIHQYHAVMLNISKVVNGTVIVLKPLPTCNTLQSCGSCESSNIGFNCIWCPQLDRCSDGFDRYRQEWMSSHCENRTTDSPCAQTSPETPSTVRAPQTSETTRTHTPPTIHSETTKSATDGHDNGPSASSSKGRPATTKTASPTDGNASRSSASSSKTVVTASILVVVFLLIALTAIGIWVVYAYKHPTTKSGQFLIQLQRNRRRDRSDKSVKYKYKQTVGMSSVDDEEGLSSLKEDVDI